MTIAHGTILRKRARTRTFGTRSWTHAFATECFEDHADTFTVEILQISRRALFSCGVMSHAPEKIASQIPKGERLYFGKEFCYGMPSQKHGIGLQGRQRISNLEHPICVTYDPKSGKIHWTQERKTIAEYTV